MANVVSDIYPDSGTVAPSGKMGGKLRIAIDTFELPSTLSTNDIIQLVRLDSMARICDVQIWHDAIGGTFTLDLGLYDTDGTVRDQDGFASGVDLAAAHIDSEGVHIRLEAGASGGYSNIDSLDKALYELVGDADPHVKPQYDLCFTVASSSGISGGTLTFLVYYTDDG